MFDVGFSEILVIAVVALIVIGPERLPRTARMLGHLFGRLQRYVNEVKADINREMELDELRRLQREVTDTVRPVAAVHDPLHGGQPESSGMAVQRDASAACAPTLGSPALLPTGPA